MLGFSTTGRRENRWLLTGSAFRLARWIRGEIRRWRPERWLLRGLAGLTLFYILTPLFFVTWLSFYRQEIPSYPPQGHSLRWYAAAIGDARFVDGFLLSLQ